MRSVPITKRLCFLVPLLAGCGGSHPTDSTTPPETPPDFVVTTVGTLVGDNQSAGFAVNNSGQVVGQSVSSGAVEHAYYWDGSMHDLTPPGARAVAYAISSGSPVYAAGYQQLPGGVRNAVIWTPQSSTTPTVLETSESWVMGVNDAGLAVGRYTDANSIVRAALWRAGQPRTEIAPLAGHVHGTATDINNDGIVVGISFSSQSAPDQAWIRFADGQVISLSSADDIGTSALAVSDVSNGQFYVVGQSVDAAAVNHGARWTVQLSSRTATREFLNGVTTATGVTNGGAVAGISVSGTQSGAMVWRNGTALKLETGSSAGGRNIAVSSTGTLYVSGDFFSGNLPVAARWTVH